MNRPLVAVDAAGRAPETSPTVGGRALLLAVVALAAAGVAAAVAVDLAGKGAFPTHPVSALALAASAVAVWAAADVAPVRSGAALRILSVSLLAYLWLGAGACALDDFTIAVVWSVGWIPINGLIVVVGLTAAAMPRSALVFGIVTGLWTAAAAALAQPSKPFDGLPTAAPESWAVRIPWLGDALVATFSAAMVIALVTVSVRAARAHATERRYLVNCAATTSMGLGLVAMCVALAALREPGEIDPSTGSVGYLVAIAFSAVIAAYGTVPSPWPLRLVIAYWLIAAALLAGVYASAITPVAAGVAITIAITLAAAVGAVGATVWLERRLAIAKPRPANSLARLSPRENEVLAAIAAGATNAGVAADLFLSERTVEQHVRSIFAKLDLIDRDSSNHRVRAAVIWWQHQDGDPGPTVMGNLDPVQKAKRITR